MKNEFFCDFCACPSVAFREGGRIHLAIFALKDSGALYWKVRRREILPEKLESE